MEESIFLVQPGIYKSQGRNSITINGLALDCTGSTFEFAAFCKGDVTLGIYVDAPDSYENQLYFTVYNDGQLLGPREKYKFGGTGKREFVIAQDLEEGYHTFSIVRQNESEMGEFCIKYIMLTGRLQTPPRERERYIEFVGDSITTGIGNLYTPETWDPNVDPKSKVYQDGTQTYGLLAARKLRADYSVVAQQGIGIICGWQPHTMLDTYEMTCYQRNRRDDWNFIRQPDFTVINLGSNDSDKIEENGKTFEDVRAGAVRLSNIIRSHYPSTGIVWATGMIGQQMCPYIRRAVEDLGGAANRCYYLQLESDTAGGGSHPSLVGQRRNAEILYDFLKSLYDEQN